LLAVRSKTTDGDACSAAEAKPVAGSMGAGAGAELTVGGLTDTRCAEGKGSHSGRKVDNTKAAARATVQAWAKISHQRRSMFRDPSTVIRTTEIDQYLDTLLAVGQFKDYCPNGLQVQGKPHVERVIAGVTASRALIDAAIAAQADAILVHHGLFWRGQDGRLTGWLAERVKRLLAHDINVFAYHLPLDAHPTLGNNAALGEHLGWPVDACRFGEQSLGFMGSLGDHVDLASLVAGVQDRLCRSVLALPGDGRRLRRVAWCTGGAQGYFEAAIAAGADVFLTGEVSEPQMHLAAESGVAYLAAGHHATERYGVQALGQHIAEHFGVSVEFIDVPNPA
jgi:dinuclear metal center YbgI/SA1388 family protein